MPAAAKFATGKYAYGICDVCGVSNPLNELRMTTVRARPTGIMACRICWDPDHPQNFLPNAVQVDAEALRITRSENYDPSRRLAHWRPADSFALVTQLGEVEVLT